MKKIINYIAGGQGLGIKFTALLALLLSIVFGATVKVMGSDAVPYAQQIADQMLPIKVVNGQIVEPADTYKVVHLRFNEDSDPYPCLLYTTGYDIRRFGYQYTGSGNLCYPQQYLFCQRT